MEGGDGAFSLDNNPKKFVARFQSENRENKQRQIRAIKMREFKVAEFGRNFLLVYRETRRKLIT